MIGIKNKEPFLRDLSILSQALTRITHVIVNLTPIGVFAISAGAAGTMTIDQFERLQIYFICYIMASLLMTFVVIPFIGTAITPFRYRDIVGASKDALLTGFTTGNLFIVLPVVEKNIKELFERYNKNNEETAALIDIITPVYFNFPDTGKLLSLIFILFGAWFSGAPMPLSRYPDFAMTGFFTFFGGADIAIPFLLKTFQIPSDLFHLYIVAGILNGRFSTLLAVMDLFVFSLLCTSALIGLVQIKLKKVIFYASTMAILVILVLVGTKLCLNNLLKPSKKESEFLINMKIESSCKSKVLYTLPSVKTIEAENKKYAGLSVLEKVRRRGFLRVGYNPDALPFAFFNKKNQLVGFDIETANRLGADLNAEVRFVPFRNSHITEDLNKGFYDIAMSGVTVTVSRLEKADFTQPYMELTLALVVSDYKKDNYNSQKELQKMKNLKIAVLNNSVHGGLLKKYLPNAKIIKIDRREDFFTKKTGANALLISAEEGAAWTLVYPEYGIAVPKPLLLKMNAAYPLPKGDLEFANFMDQWLEMQKANGAPKKQYNYWILGKEQKKKQPRWSIIRNVLGWGK
jgi:ABC-type amino acid transport substrate-binding protein